METTEFVLSKDQKMFLDAARADLNIFLTGKAGTGKSFIVKHLIQQLKDAGKKVVALAPTGVAATNIGGQTIHSLFAINPFEVSTYETIRHINSEKRKLLDAVDVFLIDEVSMLRPDVLDAMHWTLVKNKIRGLDKKQVIFVGDLKQLPAPTDRNTKHVILEKYDDDGFANAKIFPALDMVTIELEEILRQNDPEFIEALNVVRDGGDSPYFDQFVTDKPSGIILCPYNAMADRYNEMGLKALKTKEYVFDATISGGGKPTDFNLPAQVRVKHGAKVMYLVNERGTEIFNGTIGTFEVDEEEQFFFVAGDIRHPLRQVTLLKQQYSLNDSGSMDLVTVGSIKQYPIKLAYALSIHKAQGLTFDEVTLDLTRPCFETGQLYVALSRVRTPQGLKIKK